MERRGHGERDGTHGALALGDLAGPLDGGGVAGDDHLAGRIVVGDVADLALSGLGGDGGDLVEVEAEDRRHGTGADRGGRLHGGAAQAQQPGGVGDGDGAGGGQRRILAQRMAGDEGGVALQVEPGLGLQHAQRRERGGHQRRLGVGGERQRLDRPVPHDGRQLLAQRLVDFLEHGAGDGELIGEGLAHADRLAALPGKHEGAAHDVTKPAC